MLNDKKWIDAISSRFADRDELDKEDLCLQFFTSLPMADVLECLSLLEAEFSIPIGKFRPSDSLSKFFEPVSTCNPLKRAVYEVMAGDRQLEMGVISL